jgi:trans-aconitate 2-methyltransferase
MWDPARYLDFAEHRGRPFFELVARVGATRPRRVADLGCGPGTLTATLGQRWPDTRVDAVDSDAAMVAAARENDVDATRCDLRDWHPGPDTDVVVSNAALQWIPGHDNLLTRWVSELPAGGWLAFQVPGNFGFPSHRTIRELAGSAAWRARLGEVGLRDETAVCDAEGYATLLTGLDCAVDAWETTYLQRLTGQDPVLDWVSGTALRPVRAALDDAGWEEFRRDLAPRLRQAYPAAPDGSTWFPLRRIFVVATTAEVR